MRTIARIPVPIRVCVQMNDRKKIDQAAGCQPLKYYCFKLIARDHATKIEVLFIGISINSCRWRPNM